MVHPAQLDIRRLNEERLSRPDEDLALTLARLGWVPPSTADDFRQHISRLEGRHKTAGELAVGDQLRSSTKRIIAIGRKDEFIYVTLEDGINDRYTKNDSVVVD